MTQITLKGNPCNTCGELPLVGSTAPDFTLVRQDLSEATLATYAGKKKIVSIFPSIDTPVCATSIRTFTERAGSRGDAVVLNVSADLPFAQKRFCAAEGIENAETLSTFRGRFGTDWGVTILDGPLAGLLSRAVVVLDENDKVLHAQQVPEIGQEPNYDAALGALSS